MFNIYHVSAADPTAENWFGLDVLPTTNSVAGELNYYYVGQLIDVPMQINSIGSSAANIWVDYDSNTLSVEALATGSYYDSWSNQSVEGDRILSTGYNFPAAESSGEGDFGSIQLKAIKPTAASYGKSSPTALTINKGEVGATTESNIANEGIDLLSDVTNTSFYVWADTKKPYIKNISPADQSDQVAVDSLFQFDLMDSLNGEGDDSGSGTGIDLSTTTGQVIYVGSDGAEVSLTDFIDYDCSGVWGSESCEMVVNPPILTDFTGDTRHWAYDTTYQFTISGYQDLASDNQSQLGDSNGPNVMNSKVVQFTTESDVVAPQISSVVPASGAENQPLNRKVSFNVTDRRSYPNGISGSGVNLSSCLIEVSSPAIGFETYAESDPEVSVGIIDYGLRYELTFPESLSANDQINVRIYSCNDLFGNRADDYEFVFKTIQSPQADSDQDGGEDGVDNCPADANGDQLDTDNDGLGDACDSDKDNDGIENDIDNCPLISNVQQNNKDGDAFGDACDFDLDGDNIENDIDNCPDDSNENQEDLDQDGLGDACDSDADGDEILNQADNCPFDFNPDQSNVDGDTLGDVCDLDKDGDGIENDIDNCPDDSNADQADEDNDGLGNVCDLDAGTKKFIIEARPEKRVFIKNALKDFSIKGLLSFYDKDNGRIAWQERVSLNSSGKLEYSTDQLAIGNYSVTLKSDSHLARVVPEIKIVPSPTPILLDYTFGNTFNLIAGDVVNDNLINAYDLATVMSFYGAEGDYVTDLNKDQKTNASDLSLLIINYKSKGDFFKK